jgi:pimeloyl-ACP methyl ester carboxylesterase
VPYTTNQGIRIYYQVEGEGPPLVIQHGFTDSMQTWYDLGYVEALTRNYWLILVDARGHGHSDKLHDLDAYGMESMAGDVVAVLDAVHVPQAHFMGYSMGGEIGFGMAKYAPERLHSLIIGGSHPYRTPPERLQQRLQGLQKGAEAIAEMWDAPVSPTIRTRLLANDIDALIARTKKRMESGGFAEVLPTMKMPCLLYAGEADGAYPGVKECIKQMPNVTFVSFPGLNHVETLFHPDLVVPQVMKFLQAVCEGTQVKA